MNTTSPKRPTAERPVEVSASRNHTLVTMIGPILLAVGWVLTSHLPNSPLWIAVTRILPAGIILLSLKPDWPTGAWWLRSIVLGLANFACFFTLQAVAVHHIPVGVAATITSMQALLVPLGAVMLVSTPLRPSQLWYATTGMAGVAMLVLRGDDALNVVGIVAAIGTALCNTLGLLLTRRWSLPCGVHHLTATGWQMTAGGLLLLPVAIIVEGKAPHATVPILATMAVVIACTAGAFGVLFGAVSSGVAPATVSRLMLLCPVTVTLVDVILYQRTLTPLQCLGTLAVLLPVVAACRPRPAG